MNHIQQKKTSQRAQLKQAQRAHPARSLQGSHVAESADVAAPPRDSALVRAASSLGASAAAGLVTAATFPAASIVLPIGLAVLGGAVVAMIGRHQAA